MTPEEYTEKYDQYTADISRLKKEQQEMRANYIEQNRKFTDLDKVKLIYQNGKTEEAYIFGANCIDGHIYYSFLQVKKNGLPSQNKYYADGSYGYSDYGIYYELELIEAFDPNKNYQS